MLLKLIALMASLNTFSTTDQIGIDLLQQHDRSTGSFPHLINAFFKFTNVGVRGIARTACSDKLQEKNSRNGILFRGDNSRFRHLNYDYGYLPSLIQGLNFISNMIIFKH